MKTLNRLFILLVSIVALTSVGCHKKLTQQKVENKDQNKEQKVLLSTAYGDIVLKLYNETPQHRDNFIKLVNDSFYHDLLFHRVIRNFMIQGGDPESKDAPAGKMLGSGGLGYTVPAEFDSSLIHKKGALSAARMGDQVNPTKASSACQFYIVQGEVQDSARLQMTAMRSGVKYTPEQIKIYTTIGGTPFLDMNYTVFGEVVSGLEVVDKIAAVQTAVADRPMVDVKFTITLIKE